MYLTNEIYFIHYIAYNTNNTQTKKLIEHISPKQISDIRKICKNTLTGKLNLNKNQYRKLQKHKAFIRKVAHTKITKNILVKNFKVLQTLAQVFMENGTYKKDSSGGVGRMELNNEETRAESNSQQSSDSESDIKSFYDYYYGSSSENEERDIGKENSSGKNGKQTENEEGTET